MLATKGMRLPIDVILVCIRWYATYPLSYRHLEEMMQERGVFVDHSSINRWAIRFLPALEKFFRKHKRPVGVSWRMDETYIKASSGIPIIARQVKYLNNIVEQDHRAVKRVTKPMLNFKSFQSTKCMLAGIELMHMIRKGQLMLKGCSELSFADQFYALAGKIRPVCRIGICHHQNHVHQWLTQQNQQ